MSATLSALPHAQREAIRLAVIALEYQSEFRGGCDTKVWHPAPVTRSIRDIEREKKERAAKAAHEACGAGGKPDDRARPTPNWAIKKPALRSCNSKRASINNV